MSFDEYQFHVGQTALMSDSSGTLWFKVHQDMLIMEGSWPSRHWHDRPSLHAARELNDAEFTSHAHS